MSIDDNAPLRETGSLELEDVLGEIDNALNGLTSSAHIRELRAKAETYREQIAQAPNDAQREALGELLAALRATVREAAAKTR